MKLKAASSAPVLDEPTFAPGSAAGALPTIKGLRWYICGLLFLVTFINYVDRVSLGAMAPLLQKEIGWDDAEFGWINFCFALSYALMFPVAGRLIDRIGVRKGLALGVVVWSIAAAGHSLASSAFGFAMARLVLGVGEATNFPACIKAVAEWFPKRERSLATGIFNTGTNFAAMLQGAMMAVAVMISWRVAFIVIGVFGLVWLVLWWRFYRPPEEHPQLGAEEASLIREGQEATTQSLHVPWQMLLRYRQAWAFLLGKALTDPVWWFYLTWLPTYLKRERDVSLTGAAGALAVIYLAADFGSVFGGFLPGYLMRRGWNPSKARMLTMLMFALGLPISALAVMADDLWTTVALISVATSCHQAWSANLFTIASDAFPKRAVGSVVGFGAMCGGIGGLFMNLIAGGMLQWLGSYTLLFIFAGAMHPLAWLAIRGMSGRTLKEVDLDHQLDVGSSPLLRSIGLGLVVVGALLSGLVINNWQAILDVTKNSTAAAAGGLASAGLIALLGGALIIASRPQKMPVAAPASN
jgi:ACS family hexuronate transporter-like MFS transporter